MSFTGTPLGQGRRLDHHTFLNKPQPTNRPPSPSRSIPSYSYGAPLGSRSPPKPYSPTRDKTNLDDSTDEPALTRFNRLKQRDQNLVSRPGGPRTITSPPKPEKWSVKDTTVNIATAFHQAATSAYDMPPSDPNNSWASGSRTTVNVPRSTSVEYEKETQSTSSRRLAPPPSRSAAPTSRTGGTTMRKPLSKQVSIRHVPDSEGEEDTDHIMSNGRAKSPLDHIVDAAKRLAPTTFFMRQHSHELEDRQPPATNGHGKDTSYDYSAEEREFQAAQKQSTSNSRHAHKRNRMSLDNKAYRPTQSDLEDSDGDFEDDGKTRRRKKTKKRLSGGLSLPQIHYDKKKRKKGKGDKNPASEGEEESDDEDQSDEHSHQHQSRQRDSGPPSHSGSFRGSVAPQYGDNIDTSMDLEHGLESIPEHDERPRSSSRGRSIDRQQSRQGFSIGGVLGKIVHIGYSGVMDIVFFILKLIGAIFFLLGRVLGTVFEVICLRPLQWMTSTNTGPLITLAKYLFLAVTIYSAWYMRDPILRHIPSLSASEPYYPPNVPAANIAELSARLQRIENAFSGLSVDNERSRSRQDNEARTHSDLIGRLGALEARIQKESLRAVEAEEQSRASANQGLKAVRRDVEDLHAHLQASQSSGSKSGEGALDEEAQAKLKSLEERVGSVEGGVKEAIELGKRAGKGDSAVGHAWWKLGGISKGLTIKSSDGQDITSLIGHLVDSAVSRFGKDTLARPDFALHSGGAMIIPSLTSPTFEIRPQNLRGHLVGLVTGNGYAIGRPPITALHHELHNGHCWPFAGSEGQLGVSLAAPAHISDVTIDHVSPEVAFDMRSAPREMELWGMVEGRDNIAKVKAWQADRIRRRKEAEFSGNDLPDELKDVPYPRTLPKHPLYIRLANFSYDIHAPNNIQTFPVDQEVRDLDVDFGIVVLRMMSNWGRSEFTCLYRMRVHGHRMGEIPLPLPEELS